MTRREPPQDPPAPGAATQPATDPLAATVASTSPPAPVAAGSTPVTTGAGGAESLPAERYAFSGTVLGRGGMGEVRVCDDRRIGREVALKVMQPGSGADAVARARFLREARIQGRLEHPAIVPVHDLGVGPDGLPYFTMKRLGGLTLEQVLDKLRAGDARTVEQHNRRKLLTHFTAVCQAVEFAHTRGVLHRDLKPGNVMLGEFGEVYVLDWGIAKLTGDPDAGDAPRPDAGDAPSPAGDTAAGDTASDTGYGSVLGTPGYMAPEQLRGEIDRLDRRADVYALGATLYELLTLEPLHPRGKAAMESTLAGADARATRRAPDREVPPELEAACIRAVALARDDRYPTVRELMRDVERYLDGDRDLERRRTLAAEHVADAARAAGEVFAADAVGAGATADERNAEARGRAMRHAGRALALDPENGDALRIVNRLLLEPPRRTPPEVERRLRASLDDQSRAESRAGAWGYLACLALGPLYLLMGVRDWPLFATIAACFVLLCAASYIGSRLATPTRTWVLAVVVLNGIACALLSRIFGPFILACGFAAVSTLAFAMHPHLQRTWVTVAIGCLSVAGPAALEWAGVLPPSYGFEHGRMVVLPRLLSFSPALVMAVLLVSTLATIVGSVIIVAGARHAQVDAERRLLTQTWQLRHLVPDDRPAG